jgi:hypothetical protein
VQQLLLLLVGLINADLARRIQFLQVENEMLRDQLGEQVHTKPEERQRLLKFGLPLGDC